MAEKSFKVRTEDVRKICLQKCSGFSEEDTNFLLDINSKLKPGEFSEVFYSGGDTLRVILDSQIFVRELAEHKKKEKNSFEYFQYKKKVGNISGYPELPLDLNEYDGMDEKSFSKYLDDKYKVKEESSKPEVVLKDCSAYIKKIINTLAKEDQERLLNLMSIQSLSEERIVFDAEILETIHAEEKHRDFLFQTGGILSDSYIYEVVHHPYLDAELFDILKEVGYVKKTDNMPTNYWED